MPLGLFLCSVLSAGLIALGIVMSQFGLRHLKPLAGASISVPTSAAFFLVLSPFTIDWVNWDKSAVLLFALSGLVYPAAVTLLNFVSNRRLGANLTAAMGNLTPLFAVGLAILILGESLRMSQSLGIAIILGGLLLITMDRIRSFPDAGLWLLMIPVAGAMLRGATQPLVKAGLLIWPNAFVAVTAGYVVSASVILSFRLAGARSIEPYNKTGVAWFVGIGLANGCALLFLYLALSLGPVTAVAPVVATYPLITYAINRIILKQRGVSLRGLGGITLSVVGVVILLTF